MRCRNKEYARKRRVSQLSRFLNLLPVQPNNSLTPPIMTWGFVKLYPLAPLPSFNVLWVFHLEETFNCNLCCSTMQPRSIWMKHWFPHHKSMKPNVNYNVHLTSKSLYFWFDDKYPSGSVCIVRICIYTYTYTYTYLYCNCDVRNVAICVALGVEHCRRTKHFQTTKLRSTPIFPPRDIIATAVAENSKCIKHKFNVNSKNLPLSLSYIATPWKTSKMNTV